MGYSLMLAMRSLALVAMTLLMSACSSFVGRYGSLSGGRERGSAGAVALDELAAQLTFGFVHNAPCLGIRHAHALGGAVEQCSRAIPCSSKTQPWPNTPGRSLSHA